MQAAVNRKAGLSVLGDESGGELRSTPQSA